jgi:hypothetical protein
MLIWNTRCDSKGIGTWDGIRHHSRIHSGDDGDSPYASESAYPDSDPFISGSLTCVSVVMEERQLGAEDGEPKVDCPAQTTV